jgi:hypothetical protein
MHALIHSRGGALMEGSLYINIFFFYARLILKNQIDMVYQRERNNRQQKHHEKNLAGISSSTVSKLITFSLNNKTGYSFNF